MKPIIKDDILEVLREVEKVLNTQNYLTLAELSNHTIHDASIFQEEDPLTLAVLVYALSKIIQRCIERNRACPVFVPTLHQAIFALEQDNENEYRAIIKKLILEIERVDSNLKIYIQEVIDRAKIKKASKLHEHGISLARTAELLGISQWELQQYVGKQIGEFVLEEVPILKRLQNARKLFP